MKSVKRGLCALLVGMVLSGCQTHYTCVQHGDVAMLKQTGNFKNAELSGPTTWICDNCKCPAASEMKQEER